MSITIGCSIRVSAIAESYGTGSTRVQATMAWAERWAAPAGCAATAAGMTRPRARQEELSDRDTVVG